VTSNRDDAETTFLNCKFYFLMREKHNSCQVTQNHHFILVKINDRDLRACSGKYINRRVFVGIKAANFG
jgi:hypothetical protein